MACDSCQALRINGVFCHEAGCPNGRSRWCRNRQIWIKLRTCFECGCDVDAGEPCCEGDQF